MKNYFISILRLCLIVALLAGTFLQPQRVEASTVIVNDAVESAAVIEDLGYDPALAAPGPEPASSDYTVLSQEMLAGSDEHMFASSGAVTVDGSSGEQKINPLNKWFAPFALSPAPASVYVHPAGSLDIEPITAYNLIVDSNVLAPSSYGPNAATLGAKFCNNTGGTLNNIWVYTGDYNVTTPANSTPGTYPVHDDTTDATFDASFPHLATAPTAVDYGDPTRFYALEHEGGSTTDATDASRYIGTLAAGECRTQYWLVSYPRKALIGGSWVDVTGGVKPQDDLWLQYDFWAVADSAPTSYYTRSVTMRNEISAMANKIWPNGDNKVPDQYVNAIAQALGWDTLTPSGGATAYPGETVTSQGIWYDFGNVGAGFDNNYDLVPDRNAWVQPIGDVGSYDPGCFRLVRTYGLVIVKLNDGTELLIPFVDQMYFENIPDNNNGAVGLVFYEYAALDGACVAGLTPYQEVASGYDNEKFNADFGAGIPPLQSRETNMTFDKSGPGTVSLTGTMTYTMTFTLPDADTGNATTTVVVGSPSFGTPLTFYDAVPVGLQYVAGSASSSATMTNYTSGSVAATRLYSVDGGVTWTTTDPGNYTSTSTANQLVIQWRLAEGITSPTTGPAVTGAVSFQAVVPNTYTSTIINNTACLKLGNADCFVEDEHPTLVNGAYSITGSVFCDDGSATGGVPCDTGSIAGVSGSGWRENGSDEPGMGNISVSLYYDANNNNAVDSGDTLLSTTTTARYNVFDGYIDMDNDANTTVPDTGDDGTLAGRQIIDGRVDISGNGTIGTEDDGSFAGFTVIDGRLDTNRSGTVDTTDDGTLAPYYFGTLPGNTNYVVVVDTNDTDIPVGYTNTTPSTRSADIVAANITDVDFAFAPALTLVKRLDSPAVTIVGQTANVQYTLRITNNIPGSGGPTSFCTYTVWASEAHVTTGDNPDGGGPTNAQFQNPNNSLGAPDDTLATTVMLDNTDVIGLTGFNTADLGGNITKVETLVYMRETLNLDDDQVIIRPYYDNAQLGTDIIYAATYFTSSVGTEYILVNDITSRRASWAWSDFRPIAADNETRTEVQVEGNRIGGSSGDIGLDAVAYRITTDQVCNDPSQIINPLPLTDTYESDYLTFVSADPAVSSSSVSSGTGTLTWDNLGPLYPGQTKEIIVTFYAEAITNIGDNDADNTASITNAKFGNGRDTNDVTDNTPVQIIDDREIHGVVWYDTDGDGWQGAPGYEDPNPDEWIPNVEVDLWACELADGTYVDDDGTPNVGANDTCAEMAGQWVLIATDTTDNNGQYDFTGLFPGYYIVKVNASTLPSGATQTADPNDLVNLCGICNNQMGLETEDLQDGTIINLDANAADLSADNVNFGYDYNAGIYGNVWENLNGDRTKDAGENPIGSGVTVRLYNWTDDGDNLVEAGEVGSLVGSEVTDGNGNFFFSSGVTGGSKYIVNIDTATLPAGSTWTITDEDNPGASDDPISGDNEYNYIGVTAVTNTNTGSLEFGITRSGARRIGDTLFYDWDGDSMQDAGVDEGIPNITVSLYTDADNDGLVEAGDFLVNSTATLAYPVIDGQLDINFDGSITGADNGSFAGYTVVAGRLDINGGGVDGTDDGTANGVAVIDGYLDIDGDGVTSADGGDDIALGQYAFNNLSSRGYVVIVDTADAQFPPNVSQTKDPDESGVCSTCDSRSRVTYTEISTDVDGFVDTEDFGYYPFSGGTIGDIVWQDNNGDGLKGITEPALSGVTVLLQVDLNGDGTYSTISTTTTSSSGAYLFSNLPLGSQYNYRVVVELSPANNAIIPNDDLGNEYLHSTGTLVDTITDFVYVNATITSGSPNYLTADFGFAPPASFGDTVYQDINNNGTQDLNEPGINGVTVRLYTFTDLGDGDGMYDPGEPFYDENGNTTWDAGEPFFDQDGRYQPGDTLGTLVATTTTATVSSAAGKYQFAGLTPGYYVAVVDPTSTPLIGSTLTGDPATDGISCTTLTALSSPPSSVCDHRDGTRLYNATNYTGADFGYLLPGAIGDTLWIDTNNNGIRDLTEVGIDNVTVYLCDSSDTLPCNAGNANATTVTDANGNYSFTSLSSNTYYVTVDATDTDLTSLGLTQTYEMNDGTPDDTTTIVVNNSGSVTSINGTACTGCNLNIDFGYRYQGGTIISGTICLEQTADGVCGVSTADTNGVGSGETAYDNVSVFLYRLDDTVIANGQYDAGETTTLIATTSTFAYRVIDGALDINGDGSITTTDDGTTSGCTVTDGLLSGCTTYNGFNVITGYIDVDRDGTTSADPDDDFEVGDYAFPNVVDGVYYIIAIGAPQSGLELTSSQTSVNTSGDTATTQYVETTAFDGSTLSAYQVVNTSGDTDVTDRDFAFELDGSFDFGDLPTSYSTTLAGTPDGARHEIPVTPTLYFGSNTAPPTQADLIETDGQPTTGATGDGADEDGVSVDNTLAENADGWSDNVGTLQFDIVGSGWLVAWVDANNDGDFSDTGEMIINRAVSSGQNQNIDFSTASLVNKVDGSYSFRFRLFPSQPAISTLAYSGVATNGEVEDYKFTVSGGTTTPVTLSYFHVQRKGSEINFEWSTATETDNIGFNLFVEQKDGNLTQINAELIPSKVIDSLDRQDYTYSLNMAGNVFYIEDVSLQGETRLHGPFVLGKKSGIRYETENVSLVAVQQEHVKKYVTQQKELKKLIQLPAAARYSPIFTSLPGSYAKGYLGITLALKVRQTGLYRITYNELKAAGLDLAGVPISKIALTNRGKQVPIMVQGPQVNRFSNVNAKFGSGYYIEFYGEALDTAYTDTNVYILQVNKSASQRISTNNTVPARRLVSPETFTETVTVNKQLAYANSTPGNDPWYDTVMYTTTTSKSWNFPFQVLGLANASAPAELRLSVFTQTNMPQDPDHHFTASLNGVQLANEYFDGTQEKTLTLNIPANTLREGENTLQITLPGDTGASMDIIYFDQLQVNYKRSFRAVDGKLTFKAAGKAFTVTDLPSQDVVVYRVDSKGITKLSKLTLKKVGNSYSATFAGSGALATYYVATTNALQKPTIEATRLTADLNLSAQYIIIAHPDFIDGLQPLIAARRAQGLTVSVVNVNDLYAQYGYGIFDPQAIKDYIAHAVKNLGTEYILLVGGDTYDYRNFTGKNSISFIPSLYATTGDIAKFVPVDPLYADIDNDNVPDAAIGRFPVRTTAELTLIVNKTLSYQSKDYSRTAIFASDKYDNKGVSFKQISEAISAGLSSDWTTTNVHLDDTSMTDARTQLISAMNNGSALVSYTGHSGPVDWTSGGLFTTKDAAALTNKGRPFVVVQWGCWNTYYVNPGKVYLVQSFLFSGEQGAAAVFGASTLTDSESEQLLGELLMPRLTTPGMPMGKALTEAKAELAQTHPELLDVLLGWTLMGDPALVIEP